MPSISEKIVNNTMLTIAGRFGMALFLALMPFLITWFVNQSQALASVDKRVNSIETRISITAPDQDRFQDETKVTLKLVLETQTKILEKLARLDERTNTSGQHSND